MDELRALFGRPELAWLLDRLAQRVQRGVPLDTGTATKRDATPAERRAIDDLLGRRSTTGTTLSVNLATLGQRVGGELFDVVNDLRGPLRNLRAERDAESAAWDDLATEWRRRVRNTEAGAEWLEGLLRDGSLKRFAGRDAAVAGSLLEPAWAVLSKDFHDGVLLANLAAQVTGDSHALDRANPLGTLCLRGIAARNGIDGSRDAAARREAWASIGVEIDDLSAPVLCLNLRAAADSDAAGWIAWHAARGEPFFLPWRQIKDFAPAPDNGAVFVCENPAVVSEAANRLGPRSRPLICLNGRPNAAAKHLLERIRAAGGGVRLRADFDWMGLKIVHELHEPGVTRLWRMTAADYRQCGSGVPLRGPRFIRAWNRDLARAMSERGFAGYEESILELLIEDLATE